jgi:hypothetical protein
MNTNTVLTAPGPSRALASDNGRDVTRSGVSQNASRHLSDDHRARYLVLFGAAEAPRAALFDIHERLLTEMIEDDGYIVDNLVRASTACAAPRPAMVDAIEAIDRDADLAGARCFRLG